MNLFLKALVAALTVLMISATDPRCQTKNLDLMLLVNKKNTQEDCEADYSCWVDNKICIYPGARKHHCAFADGRQVCDENKPLTYAYCLNRGCCFDY